MGEENSERLKRRPKYQGGRQGHYTFDQQEAQA